MGGIRYGWNQNKTGTLVAGALLEDFQAALFLAMYVTVGFGMIANDCTLQNYSN